MLKAAAGPIRNDGASVMEPHAVSFTKSLSSRGNLAHTSTMQPRVLIFTRWPEPGAAKTRLIPAMGAEEAAGLQREMTEHATREAFSAGAKVEVRTTGGDAESFRTWLGSDITYVDQGAGSLGDRMHRAFVDHLQQGPRPVVIMGADCPRNDGDNLKKAVDALAQYDVVLGPATDGGYYLIGLKQPAAPLFENIEWGSHEVLEKTRAAAEGAGLSVHLLPELPDVDVPEDVPPRISVIIPTLNEEDRLLQTIGKATAGFRIEVIIADGGSEDRTLEAAAGARVLTEKGGRAAQQNAGARHAKGEILLFLHADTRLPEKWDWAIRDALNDSNVALGAFSFAVSEPFRGSTRLEQAVNKRARQKQMPYGDQGLFLRRTTFEKLGGFPDLPIMEDYALVRAARSVGTVVTVDAPAMTSARRWKKHGVFKVALINALMIRGYHMGIAPEKLARFYRGRG